MDPLFQKAIQRGQNEAKKKGEERAGRQKNPLNDL